jgi:hypothetical protein
MAPLRETGADFVETPVGLGSWLSAFEASFARTFRTVASGVGFSRKQQAAFR